MKKIEVKKIESKKFHLVIGIFMCLISLVLIFNVGYVARGLTYVPTFVLGFFSYFLYGFLYANGLSLIFKDKLIKIRFSLTFILILIFILGLLGFLTHFSVDQKTIFLSFQTIEDKSINFFTKLQNTFNNVIDSSEGKEVVGTYFSTKKFSLVFGKNEFGCGIIGFAFVALFNSLLGVNFGGLIFSIVFMIVSLGFCIGPKLYKILKNSKKINENHAKKSNGVYSETRVSTKPQKRISNIDVISDASKIDDNYENDKNNENNIIQNTQTNEIAAAFSESLNNNGVFSEAIFIDDFNDNSFNSNNEQKVAKKVEENPKPIFKETVFSEEVKQMDLNEKNTPSVDFSDETKLNNENDHLLEKNEIEIKNESIQLELDFDSKPQFDEKLVTKQPEFEEPVTINAPINPASFEAKEIEKPNENPQPTEKKKKERVVWLPPSTDLLNEYESTSALEENTKVAEERKGVINTVFNDFKIGAEVVDYTIGPSVTRFNIRTASNVSVRSITNLIDDISIRLGGITGMFNNVVEGQSTSGLELPNAKITTVSFKDIVSALPDAKKHPLSIGFGKDIKGDVIYADYDDFPHMLVAGTTKSGKSVFINSVISTLIMRNSPDDLKVILVDPKRVEMTRYSEMPHLLCPIITEPPKVKLVLDKLVEEMEDRYRILAENGATNIGEYNEDCETNGNEKMYFIFVVLDEYSDLIDQCKEISMPVNSLAQKARACGIHLLVATQRPSANIINGVIKANLPCHVALMTGNSVDSVTIIGEGGAEKLLGKGDMLVQSPCIKRTGLARLQGCFIDRHEISHVVSYLKTHYETNYDEKLLDLEEKATISGQEYANSPEFKDSLENSEESKYQSVKEWVMCQEYMSISRIQRECGVGFNRAGRFFLRLQNEGVVDKVVDSGHKGCQVLLSDKFGNIDDTIVTSEESSYIKK